MIKLTLVEHLPSRSPDIFLNIDHIVSLRPLTETCEVTVTARKSIDIGGISRGGGGSVSYIVKEDAGAIASLCERSWTGKTR